MPVPLAYLNGRFLPASQLALPAHDAGFVFGATATDLVRTFRHRPFRLADHLARFRRSCDTCRIPQPVPDAELARIAEELIAHNRGLAPGSADSTRGFTPDTPHGIPEPAPAGDGSKAPGGGFAEPGDRDLALVLFATPGPIGTYAGLPGGPGDGPPTLGLHTFPLPFARYRRLFTRGAGLVVPDVRHVPSASVDPTVKQRSRLVWWIAERQARDQDPAALALLLDQDGFVTETAAANFLIVRGGAVISPPRSSVLDGISLRVVTELCGELGIPFREERLTVADCLAADEAMLTCTSYCVAGVSSLDGRPIPWPGPVWQRLLAAWSRQVGMDIAGQILAGESTG
jgi:branched-subunit amino acid aminotransferase/4-amino-4-deoxychorismate lyase